MAEFSKCDNGKWRIGEGSCIYNNRAQAQNAAASGQRAATRKKKKASTAKASAPPTSIMGLLRKALGQ